MKLINILNKLRDFLMFLSGVIVSGYIVGVFLTIDITIYHIITIVCGCVFSLIVHIYIIPTIDRYKNSLEGVDNNKEKAWENLNDDINAKKILGYLPNKTLGILTCAMSISLIIGIICHIIGREEIKTKSLEYKNEMIKSIDSLNNTWFDKNKLYYEKINSLINDQKTTIDKNYKKQDSVNLILLKKIEINIKHLNKQGYKKTRNNKIK